jgi:hypothetical protein
MTTKRVTAIADGRQGNFGFATSIRFGPLPLGEATLKAPGAHGCPGAGAERMDTSKGM